MSMVTKSTSLGNHDAMEPKRLTYDTEEIQDKLDSIDSKADKESFEENLSNLEIIDLLGLDDN